MSTDRSARPQGRQASDGYERRDANAKALFIIIASFLATGVLIHLITAGLLRHWQRRVPAPDKFRAEAPPRQIETGATRAFPQLQIFPALDLKQFRDREEAELHRYGWIDRTNGIARIPIERAMELVLQRGLPERSGTNSDRVGPSSLELQQQRPMQQEQERRQR